jgi:steroid 5-alpha reductase family enzyme/uncharacterized membrane protein
VLWGLGFLIFSLSPLLGGHELSFKSKMILTLVCIWSLRLSLYMLIRMTKNPEDVRYANWRKQWGKKEPLYAFLKVYLLQSAILVTIAYPLVWLTMDTSSLIGSFDFVALILFIIGFSFESIADYQMFQFKNKLSKTKIIMRKGLWSYCRHPNYFGEILIWWGFFCFTINTGFGFFSLLSPMIITLLLLKVSGVTILEEELKNRGPEFQTYFNEVSCILPFQKKHFVVFLKVTGVTLFLDFIWLGNLFNDFYVEQSKHIARINNGHFDALPWATFLVYIIIPLGVSCFAIFCSNSRSMALFKGIFYGLILYCTYEFTNLALIKDWPIEMALLDIAWGPILCGAGAFLSYSNNLHSC